MKQFIGFISGFLLCGLLSQFITFAWLTCALLAAVCGFALAWWLFFSLLEPNKALPKLLIDTMVQNPKYLRYITEKIYPKAMAQVTEKGEYAQIDLTAKVANSFVLISFMQHLKDNTVFITNMQALQPINNS